MNFLLESIDAAAAQGHNLPAIVTALTIPDIAGAVEAPGATSQVRYAGWVDRWFAPVVPDYAAHGVDGTTLYALRCKLLHEGLSNPSEARAAAKSAAAKAKKLIAFNVGAGLYMHLCTNVDQQGNSWTILRADTFCADVTAAGRSWLAAIAGDQAKQIMLSSLVDIRTNVPPLSQGVPLICAAV